MEKTAELLQLQLVVLVLGQGRSHARCVHLSGSQLRRLRSCNALTVSWDFFGPCTQVQAGGRVHRDTATIIRCICQIIWRNTWVVLSRPHHNHRNHHHNVMGLSRFRNCSSSTGVSAHHGYDVLMRSLLRAM